jgi:hypothetical protein
LQVIDNFVDRSKLPVEDGDDIVLEKRITVDEDTDIDQVVNLVDGLLEDSDVDLGDDDEESLTTDSKSKTNKLKIAYVKGDERSEGAAALDAMQDDLDEQDEDEEEEDQEILEMVSTSISFTKCICSSYQ